MKNPVLLAAWINCGWQMAFAIAWGFGLRDLAASRWGETVALLIQAGLSLLPSMIVAAFVFRYCRRIGMFR